jgi:hypothetical protein
MPDIILNARFDAELRALAFMLLDSIRTGRAEAEVRHGGDVRAALLQMGQIDPFSSRGHH